MPKPKRFTKKDARFLEECFSRPGHPEDAFSFPETAGFLFAVACCPRVVLPSEWLAVLFEMTGFLRCSIEEDRRVTLLLLSFFDQILEQVAEGKVKLPPLVEIAEDPIANLEDDASLSLWSRGWAAGHRWLYDAWEEDLPEALDKELGSVMLILSFFSKAELARDFHREATGVETTLEEMAGKMANLFLVAMNAYADLGMEIAEIINEFEEKPEPRQKKARVGRNEPCPCGSGLKYKKCCGAPGEEEKSPAAGKIEQTYEIRVTLKNISPPVWRTLAVPADIKLNFLHRVLQRAMGWTDSHLHQFRQGEQVFELPHEDHFVDPDEINPPPPPKDERKVRLREVLENPGDKFLYEYDFGDGWEHEIRLEKVKPLDPDAPYPVCLKGRRACPPEDVGGPWGYEDFLKVVRDRKHPEHKAMITWVGGDFDPEGFDIGKVNRELIRLVGPGKKPSPRKKPGK